MDRLTAIRTFGSAKYTPAGKVRVYDSRWYLVTFQNVEYVPCFDYIGLASGEYTELLPGTKAREARNARLNHCNHIEEYAGPIWSVALFPYGIRSRDLSYVASETDAERHIQKQRDLQAKYLGDLRQEANRLRSKYAESHRQWMLKSAERCDEAAERHQNPWPVEITKIR